MYTLDEKYINKYSIIDNTDIYNLRGYPMGEERTYTILGERISNIVIMSSELNHSLVIRKVYQQYSRLVELVTSLLLDDDDSDGSNYREALNQIERFRIIVKNQYRAFLEQEELAFMGKQLQVLKKEATIKLLEIQDSYNRYMETSRGGK